jgi:uncharacterized protein (TIGR03086 family)
MTTENLERAFADTRAIVAKVKADQLGDATPCASWTVKDLLDHIIGGSYHFGACVTEGKAPEGEMNVPWTADDMVAVYDGGIKDSVAAFSAPGAMGKTVEMPFGALPAPAWLQIATTDTFMHAWDLAKATGQPTDIDPELAAQLLEGAKSFIQPGFRGADGVMPFGAEQSAPAGASNADQLAAFLGRTV